MMGKSTTKQLIEVFITAIHKTTDGTRVSLNLPASQVYYYVTGGRIKRAPKRDVTFPFQYDENEIIERLQYWSPFKAPEYVWVSYDYPITNTKSYYMKSPGRLSSKLKYIKTNRGIKPITLEVTFNVS